MIKLKGIIFEDFINYKKPCMTLEFPFCDFKCNKECGSQVCQNSALAKASSYEFKVNDIIKAYLNNDITKAIVCQGLEPFDNRSIQDLFYLIDKFRQYSNDDIVIYTGFKEEEISGRIEILKKHNNIIIKFGRFIPDQSKHFDPILGVELASDNQYARRIS